MARHFISVLGTGEYSSIRYGTDEIETVFVQEAIIRQKMGKLSPEDKVTIFITDKAESDNYNNRAYNEREIERAEKNNIKLPAVRIGLRETLIKSGIAEEQLFAVKIPVGNGDAELMEIFSAIYNSLEENDEVYADITHSLRNIPMQLLAVLTFAETVKKIDVKGIYYGAFEVKQDGVAPIFDLLGYLNIIKWSFAAKSFIEFGDSDAITSLSKMEYGMAARNRAEETVRLQKMRDIAKYLNSLTHDLETARGCRPKSKATKENNIITAYEQYQKGLCEYRDFEEQNADDKIISPLNTLVDVIDEKVNIFSVDNNLDAGISAIDWAIEYKKTQQGYTALEETCKTFICDFYGLDESEKTEREEICKFICNIYKQLDKSKIKKSDPNYRLEARKIFDSEKNSEITDEQYEKAVNIIETIPFDLIELIKNISDCRNSINHFGFSNIGQYTYISLENNLKKYRDEFKKIMERMRETNPQE